MSMDEQYMSRCIHLALMGKGKVEPNPLVGAVIVQNDVVIGEGYHEVYGEAHAEVNAIRSVKDPTLLKDATIYVSLEPCAHYGKTPPCADLLVSSGFRKVVIGSSDPNPEVNGKGIERLRSAGIEVETGVMVKECDFINRKFFTYFRKKRPYVFLKWAQSPNGFIDCMGQRVWISAPEIQPLVHAWRAEYQSIMVGRITITNDNPELTVRLAEGRNPVRVIIDPQAKLIGDYKIFDGTTLTFILNLKKNEEDDNVRYIRLEEINTTAILDALYKQCIQSVMIEGGAFTINEFIRSGLWDEVKVITGIETFEEGTTAPHINRTPDETIYLFDNRIDTYYNV